MWIFHRILYEIYESCKFQRKYVAVNKKWTWIYEPALRNAFSAVEEFDRQRRQITCRYAVGPIRLHDEVDLKLKSCLIAPCILTNSSGQQLVSVLNRPVWFHEVNSSVKGTLSLGNVYRILNRNSKWVRLLGRHRCTWKDNIRTNFKEIRCKDVSWV